MAGQERDFLARLTEGLPQDARVAACRGPLSPPPPEQGARHLGKPVLGSRAWRPCQELRSSSACFQSSLIRAGFKMPAAWKGAGSVGLDVFVYEYLGDTKSVPVALQMGVVPSDSGYRGRAV